MRRLLGCVLLTLVPLSASAESFYDGFDSTTLDPAWSTVAAAGNSYSLTANPGFLRYSLSAMTHHDGFLNGYQTTFSYHSCCNHSAGLEVYRTFTGENWLFETKATDYLPDTNGRALEARIYFGDGGDDTYAVRFNRGRDLNPAYLGVYLYHYGLPNTNPWTSSNGPVITSVEAFSITQPNVDVNTNYFRLQRQGGILTAFHSVDGTAWTTAWTHDLGSALDGREQRVTLAGLSWFNTGGSYADYDYVSLEEQPVSFQDAFGSATLDPAWTAIQTWPAPGTRLAGCCGPAHNPTYNAGRPANDYSLTANPGRLRYTLNPMTHNFGFANDQADNFASPYYWYNAGLELQRTFYGTNWRLETKATYYLPATNGRGFTFNVVFGDGGVGTIWAHFNRGRDIDPNNGVSSGLTKKTSVTPVAYDGWTYPIPGWSQQVALTDFSTFYYRVERRGSVLTASTSEDGTSWTERWTHDLGAELNGLTQRVVINGYSWFNPAGSYADYEYVTLEPLLPPVLDGIGDKSVQTATPLAFTVSATDPNEGDTITYSATDLPSGASFSPETRTFSWTPLFGQQGEHDVTFTATDQAGLSDSETITITVTVPLSNVAPVMDDVECASVPAGSELAFTLSAIDGNGDAITYSATGLPAGATISSSTGAFSWTPDSSQSGQHQVTFYASDGSLSDSDTIEILVSRFEREGALQTSFGIYNQGRAGSLESHARAWLSDCPHTLGAGRPRCNPGLDHLLGTGRDVEVPVALVPGPGTPDPNSTPALGPGELAAYNGTFSTDGGFGRLAHDGDPSNAAVADAAGTFTLTTTASTSSRVGFLFERYLWVDADGARDEAHQKEEKAGQLLEELLANDAQGQLLTVQPPSFGQLSLLSATFDTVAGSAGQGTPRLEVHFLCHGAMRIRLDGTDESDVNVIGDPAVRYDTTGLTGVSGPLSADATFEDALALAGAFVITRIDFVADDPGGEGTRTYTLSSINVGTGGE